MTEPYHGYKVGDMINGRKIIGLGRCKKHRCELFKLQCPKCRHISVCVYMYTRKKCKLCFLNSKREKSHHRASV